MIGKLTGIVDEKSAEGAVIDCGGVGYDVALPLGTLALLPAAGERVTLFVHTHVREEELKLFGFASANDRAAFRTMLKVSGVGPKVALAVLGALSGGDLARAVDAADTRRLTAIPGIGKKTAERIVLELGGKLAVEGGGGAAAGPGSVLGELHAALVNLGFKAPQVERALAEVEKGAEDAPFEALLRRALALLQGTK